MPGDKYKTISAQGLFFDMLESTNLVGEVLTRFGASFTVARVTSLTVANVRSVCILAIGVGATDVGKRHAFVNIYV